MKYLRDREFSDIYRCLSGHSVNPDCWSEAEIPPAVRDGGGRDGAAVYALARMVQDIR